MVPKKKKKSGERKDGVIIVEFGFDILSQHAWEELKEGLFGKQVRNWGKSLFRDLYLNLSV